MTKSKTVKVKAWAIVKNEQIVQRNGIPKNMGIFSDKFFANCIIELENKYRKRAKIKEAVKLREFTITYKLPTKKKQKYDNTK